MNTIAEETIQMPGPSQERLTELLASLSSEQQSAVEAFIRYLQEKSSAGSRADVRAAIDDFVREHSDLLRRLAQ
ncbi:MAG TPA: hypothetical protein VG498_00955 [Terriglobales bacterium]|nr:hypothetical protein [Terriglobales bacterium]